MVKNINKIAATLIGTAMLASVPAATSNAEGIEPKDVTDMLHAVMDSDRTIYTKMIVKRLVVDHKLIKASEFYEDENAAPLPAQIFRLGAEAVADRTDLFEYSLQSLWPINKPNAKNQTELEKEGLQFVVDNKGENFYGNEEIDGTKYFTAVYADIATAKVCADCHTLSPNKQIKSKTMTPEKVKLVQDSFAKVVPIAGTAADIFYDRLFEIAPDVRSMFPAEMSNQKEKLMATLGVAVNNLHQVEDIVPTVQELGKKHVGYGVKDEHYDTVGAALIYTLDKGLGEEFTDDVKEAWVETYTLVAGVMKDAAAEVDEPKKGFFAKMFG